MKQNFLVIILIAVLSCSLASCELVEGIFKAGVWVGILVVVFIIAIIIWLISRFRR